MGAAERESPHVFIVDGHSDFIERILSERAEGRPGAFCSEYVPAMREGGVRLSVMQVGSDSADQTEHQAMAAALRKISVLKQEIARCTDARQVETRDDLADLLTSDQIGIVSMLEGGLALLDEPTYVSIYHGLGVRMVALTWNNTNRLASGNGQGAATRGLTDLGVEVVRELGRLNMILDLSHLAEPGVVDALTVATGPVIASHSNARQLCDHERNLTDEMIRAIGERGGIVGINFFPRFLDLASRPTADDIVAHIRHVIRIAGEDAVGLGPDFIDYGVETLGLILGQSSVNYGSDYTFPVGFESTRDLSKMPQVLSDAGFSSTQVDKILGGNWLRVLRQALP